MAVLADKKVVGAPFGNSVEYVHVQYSFANDTGAIADYDVLEADGALIVELEHAYVSTAVTSGGSLVIDLGKSAGGTNFWSDKAVATLTVGSVHKSGSEAGVKLADGDKIVLGLEAAAATAGVIDFVFKVKKAGA